MVMAKLSAANTIRGKVATGIRYVNQGYSKKETDELLALKQNSLTEDQLENLNEDHSKYLTEHQDISGKQDVIEDLETIRGNAIKGANALKSLSDYAKKSELPTKVSELENDKGYLTEHQSLDGYATEQWVEDKGYLTQHQDISGKQDKLTEQQLDNLNTDHSGFALKTDLNGKQDALTAGENVTIENNVISAQGKNYDNDIEEINSNVAANTEAISSQYGEIVLTQLELAEQKKINKQQQREIELLKDFTEGVAWRSEIDTEEAYTKAIPKGSRGVTVNSIGGKCIVENQLLKRLTSEYWTGEAGVTVTYNADNSIEFFNAELNNMGIIPKTNNRPNFVLGHNYYVRFKVKSDQDCKVNYSLRTSGSVVAEQGIDLSTNVMFDYKKIVVCKTASYSGNIIYFYSPTHNTTLTLYTFKVVDLTQMFGAGNEPTVEEFEAMVDVDNLDYTEPTIKTICCDCVEVQGKNLFDEKAWAEANNFVIDTDGYINGKHSYVTTPLWNNVNNVQGRINVCYDIVNAVTQRQMYFQVTYTDGIVEAFYPWASNTSNATNFVTKANKNVKSIGYASGTAGTFKVKNIHIVASDTPVEYIPYTETNITIPTDLTSLEGYGFGLNGVSNEARLDSKVFSRKIVRADMGDLTWVYSSWGGKPMFSTTIADAKSNDVASNVANVVCAKYENISPSALYSGTSESVDKKITLNGKLIRLVDNGYTDANTFKQAMQGVYLYYELAEPKDVPIADLLGDFENDTECEVNGSVTFKNTFGEDYRVPIPNELEYYVKVSEAL